MKRKILILIVLLLASAYLVVAVTVFNGTPDARECEGMELTIKDSIDNGFVTPADIQNLLKQKKLLPMKKQQQDITVRQLEEVLDEHPFVKKAECYLTSGGNVAIDIYQRIPILRVMSSNGEDYFVDSEGKIMRAPGRSVHVVVATGAIDRAFAQTHLYELGVFLQSDRFWESQIEQIHVTAQKELELVPRVGSHIIFLGKPGDYSEKFAKLQTFYKKALSQVGWNKYSRISIEFTNQIICTKKEK